MRRRGLLTRWELLVGLLLALAVTAWVTPIVKRAVWRTRLAEAPWFLDALGAQLTGPDAARAALPPTPRAAEALGSEAVPWPDPPPGGLVPPAPRAYCAYWTSGSPPQRLHAACDVDGDGVPARFESVPGGPVTALTPPGVW